MSDHVLEAFRNFRPRDVDAWMFDNNVFCQQLERQIVNFPSYVLPYVDSVTAIAGITYLNGVGEAWLLTGQGFERTAPIVLRQLQQLCRTSLDVLDLHRLHMLVDSDDHKAKLFAEKLGFNCEHERHKGMGARGNDMDMYLFERGK